MRRREAEQWFAGTLPPPSYERPPEAAVESMRKHLLEDHGLRMRLRRDVAWPGNSAKAPVLTFQPASYARGAKYNCARCPGRVFIVSGPVRGPQRCAFRAMHDPQLRMLLRGVAPERQDDLIDAYDRGELMPAIIDGGLARRRQQTKRNARPAAQRRKKRAQAWLLRRYAELGNVEDTLEELANSLRDDVEARYDILGQNAPRALETLRGDWKDIPREQREAAKRKAEARPEHERNADRAALRRRKLTP